MQEDEISKKLEDNAVKCLHEAKNDADPKKKQGLHETACNDYRTAAAIHISCADKHRDIDLAKTKTEHAKAAEDFEKCAKIKCEDGEDNEAKFFFQNAVQQYMESHDYQKMMQIINEYGPGGTKKRLQLVLKPLSNHDI